MNLKRGWRSHSPAEKRKIEVDRPFHTFLKSPIIALNALWRLLFRFLRKRLTNRHTGFNRGLFWCCDYSCVRNLESYGCNQIIVLIVPIVTLFLKEAKSFSLFNATQILSISIGETQGKKTTVVFIVLIVLIVTQLLETDYFVNRVTHLFCHPQSTYFVKA